MKPLREGETKTNRPPLTDIPERPAPPPVPPAVAPASAVGELVQKWQERARHRGGIFSAQMNSLIHQFCDDLKALAAPSDAQPLTVSEAWADAARDVLDRFHWMLSPDAKGNHTVSDLSVKSVIRFCEKVIAADAQPAQAAMYADLEKSLRERMEDDGPHGVFHPEHCIKAADAIANLRTALASQIDITNRERAQAERLAKASAGNTAEAVAWQYRHNWMRDGVWSGWKDCTPAEVEKIERMDAINRPFYEWRGLYAKPAQDLAVLIYPDIIGAMREASNLLSYVVAESDEADRVAANLSNLSSELEGLAASRDDEGARG